MRDHDSVGMALIGHSTGCQIVTRFMQMRSLAVSSEDEGDKEVPPILGTVLQAAVSDREYLSFEHREGMDRLAAKVCMRPLGLLIMTCILSLHTGGGYGRARPRGRDMLQVGVCLP